MSPSIDLNPHREETTMLPKTVGKGQHSVVYEYPSSVHESFRFTDVFAPLISQKSRRVLKCIHDPMAYVSEVRAARELARVDPHQQYIRYAARAIPHPSKSAAPAAALHAPFNPPAENNAGMVELLYSGDQTLEAALHSASDTKTPLDLITACCWLCDIGEGLLKLEEAWIRHGDLHLRNIMVDGNRAYIIDFSKASLGSFEYPRHYARIAAHILAKAGSTSPQIRTLLDLLDPRMNIADFLCTVEDILTHAIRQKHGVGEGHAAQ